MSTAISVIATLISSVALVGVAVSLLLQARQLKASQLQASRELHTELIKMGMEHPHLRSMLESGTNPEELSRASYVNFYLTFLQTGYALKSISKPAVSLQARRLFKSEYPRTWWTDARNTYRVEATTKREKEFYALVDAEFQGAIRAYEPSQDPPRNQQA